MFVRTYNQIVGSVSLETTRVSNASCAYKGSEWSMSLLETRRPKLFASEALVPRCFGPSEGGLDTTAYGPFHDVRAPRPPPPSCPTPIPTGPSPHHHSPPAGRARALLTKSRPRGGALVPPLPPPPSVTSLLPPPPRYSLAVAGPSFKMDLGKDPEFAEKKITEMRTEGFLSKHTRRVHLHS